MSLIGVNFTLRILFFSLLIPSIFLSQSGSSRKSYWHLSLIVFLFKWNTFYCSSGVPVLETDRCVWVEFCKLWLFFVLTLVSSFSNKVTIKGLGTVIMCWDPKFENSSKYIAILSLGGEEITEKNKERRKKWPTPPQTSHFHKPYSRPDMYFWFFAFESGRWSWGEATYFLFAPEGISNVKFVTSVTFMSPEVCMSHELIKFSLYLKGSFTYRHKLLLFRIRYINGTH